MEPERYNFKIVEEKWQSYWEQKKTFKAQVIKQKKNFIVWKCFLTHLEKSIWAT